VDRLTGDIWAGDVGQSAWEEVDKIVAGGNYGWDCKEGFADYEPVGCPSSGFQDPRAVYANPTQGEAVSGGYVYRGAALAELYGWYIFGDAYSGRIWALNTANNSDAVQITSTSSFIS